MTLGSCWVSLTHDRDEGTDHANPNGHACKPTARCDYLHVVVAEKSVRLYSCVVCAGVLSGWSLLCVTRYVGVLTLCWCPDVMLVPCAGAGPRSGAQLWQRQEGVAHHQEAEHDA